MILKMTVAAGNGGGQCSGPAQGELLTKCTSGYYYKGNSCNPTLCGETGTQCYTKSYCSNGIGLGVCADTGGNACSPAGCSPV